jgi:hypothetical protein
MTAPHVIPLHTKPTAHPTTSQEDTMRSKTATALVALTALAAAAAPSAALARHGADDGPMHKRHAKHHLAHDARHGRGADDGPNHR